MPLLGVGDGPLILTVKQERAMARSSEWPRNGLPSSSYASPTALTPKRSSRPISRILDTAPALADAVRGAAQAPVPRQVLLHDGPVLHETPQVAVRPAHRLHLEEHAAGQRERLPARWEHEHRTRLRPRGEGRANFARQGS